MCAGKIKFGIEFGTDNFGKYSRHEWAAVWNRIPPRMKSQLKSLMILQEGWTLILTQN